MNKQSIRNIWAVGRNYKKHAEELGNSIPDSPLIFLKAGSCIQASFDQLVFPEWMKDIHHEIEVCLQLDERLKPSHVGLAIDFTERSLQAQLKSKGQPWTLAKSFSGACAVTEFHEIASLADLDDRTFDLKVNDEVKQLGNTSDMIFDFSKIVNYVKQHFPVCPNDLILTGTPEGVGPINNGDKLEVSASFGVKHLWSVHQPINW